MTQNEGGQLGTPCSISVSRCSMKKKMSLVGEWFQGESIELQVTMLSHSQEAHHIITLTLQEQQCQEKKNPTLPFFRSCFVYGYYFVAFKNYSHPIHPSAEGNEIKLFRDKIKE